MGEWISVSERLPEVGGRYLVVTDSSSDPFVDAATWSRGVWWSGMSPAEEWGMEITHWMPLPEFPKVK